MNIKCDLKELINALNIVSKTSSSKTTMPILEGVLFEAYQNKLKLITNDLEIGSEHTFSCEVIREGKTVVDLRMLNEIVRKIEDEFVEISIPKGRIITGVLKDKKILSRLSVRQLKNLIKRCEEVIQDKESEETK